LEEHNHNPLDPNKKPRGDQNNDPHKLLDPIDYDTTKKEVMGYF